MNKSLLEVNNETLKDKNDDIFKNFPNKVHKVTILQTDRIAKE